MTLGHTLNPLSISILLRDKKLFSNIEKKERQMYGVVWERETEMNTKNVFKNMRKKKSLFLVRGKFEKKKSRGNSDSSSQ